MAAKLKVGFVGLGAMGLGMASCLAEAGFDVTGFDINQKAMAHLVDKGGKRAETPRGSATNADILVIVVATSHQVSSVLFDNDTGALASLPQNKIILLCITAAPEYIIDLDLRLKAAGRSDVKLIDCPISGGEARARQGTLSLLCAGTEANITYIRDVLNCLSSELHLIPGGIGAASSLKMVHQILVGVHILASVEVMGFAYVAGLDLQLTYDGVMSGDGASWLFGQRAAHILDEGNVPASSLMIITKDFATLDASGRKNQVSLNLASLAYQLFVLTSSSGQDTTDDCNAINIYLIGKGELKDLRRGPKPSTMRAKLDGDTITNLLMGVHAAVAIEVLNFAKKLGLDTALLRDVVKGAAGASVMFDNVCTQLHGKSEVSLKSLDNFDTLLQNLVSAIEAAKTAEYPLFFASAALQQFYNS